MVTISFPGLGIGNFTVNSVAFSLFGIEVRWYGIVITTGIILAMLYCMYRAKQEDISTDNLLDIAIYTVIFGVIGARAYYVLTSLSEYDSLGEALAIWNGGLAIYGAIIAGAITVFIVCRVKKINVAKALDMVSPAVMIGQILGRWGNFFNGEAYGTEVAEDSIFYFIRMGLLPNMNSSRTMYYFHPTFLYESLWNLVGFIIINALYKKKKFDGQVCLMYLTWYGFGRMLIEGLRTDSLYVGVFRISQVVGFVCFVGGSILLTYCLIKARRAKLTDTVEYTPTYSKLSKSAHAKNESEEANTPKED
ncbi:MAG: prolipoprotein diacylglyceryl transferase [Clostridia bacterium]|nr:prolipoprotein diacylglyceryl transferase [Clostridia bacterium]